MNDQTYKGTDASIAAWVRAGPPEDDDMEQMARFGLGVWLTLARQADEHRLPMRLDY